MRSLLRVLSGVLTLLLLPSSVWAQAAITGVVKDTSGAVLPGVTVEVASPALIEKVRNAVTDPTGQYRIVDLRPGTYTVTFSLTGFSTVKREGIELSGTFVATVNGDLKVGSLQETITVTGETPIVDVQSAKAQTTINRDIISAIPTSRSITGIQAVIPGMVGGGDSGGIGGGSGGSAGSMHGGRPSDSRTLSDGLNMGWAGANSNAAVLNSAGAQEVVLSTSGGLGEAETAGVALNVVPRDGGNTFSGTVAFTGAGSGMQSSNYTQALKDAGLRSPAGLLKVWEINPMGGGRIVRDKLWFYLTYRETYGENTVPGMFFNKNGGDPTKWLVDFGLSPTGECLASNGCRQAFGDVRDRTYIGRFTWQATPRNKFTFQDSEQYLIRNKIGGGSSTRTPEAQGLTLYTPGHTRTFTWTSPFTNKMLLEAGWGSYMSVYANDSPRIDGQHNNALISVFDQGIAPGSGTPGVTGSGIVGLTYRFDNPLGGGFQHHQIGTLANLRASISYVTGAHNLKVGYMGGFSNPSQSYYNFTPFVQFRFSGGVPNQLTETAQFGGTGASAVEFVRNLVPTSFYAQDQWTNRRLTLQGGVRYDYILTSYPDACVGGPDYPMMPKQICYPARSTPGVHWHDLTPRIGAAYDLFGDGKTAVKFNLGKYMQALTASNSDMDLNPLIRLNLVTTRNWNDRAGLGINNDYVPQCDYLNPAANGECLAMDNQNFGKEFFTRTFDPDFINGYGRRPYNWELGAAVQQQVVPRVGVTAGYYRRWFGNFYTLDNTLTAATDYGQFSVPIPVDPRLPGGGGGVVSGIYNVNVSKVGQVQDLAQLDRNFGVAEPTEYWHGVDTSVNARLRNGLIVQGGTSTGRMVQDNCALRSVLPETYNWTTIDITQALRGDSTAGLTSPYCRIVTPFQTSFRGLATYIVPKLDVQVAATWRSDPGPAIQANYVVSNSVASAALGRNLSPCQPTALVCNATATVNLIPPGTLYGDRINNLDVRVAKLFRYRRTRLQAGVDIYNVMNADVVTTYSAGYAPPPTTVVWPTPATILAARYVKISVQADF
jgi:Carboxypeptidase regulatory-like domain